MSYREQWVQDTLGKRSLLECALEVRMTANGSHQRNDPESQNNDIAALTWTLMNWKPSNPSSRDFDDAVFNLLSAALREAVSFQMNSHS